MTGHTAELWKRSVRDESKAIGCGTYFHRLWDWDSAMLGAHMIEICGVLLGLSANDAEDVMGYPDDLKLRSSMTLFSQAVPSVKIFQQVLDKYFDGKMDQKTLEILGEHA